MLARKLMRSRILMSLIFLIINTGSGWNRIAFLHPPGYNENSLQFVGKVKQRSNDESWDSLTRVPAEKKDENNNEQLQKEY